MFDREFIARGARFSGLAVEMAILVVLGAFAGSWLDGKAGTSPLFLLVLLMGALVASMVKLMASLKPPGGSGEDGDPGAS